MFIPLRHENMEGRRWPVISIALVLINLVAFLGTHWQMEDQNPKDGETRAHILLLAAMHPELTMPPDVQTFVADFQKKHPGLWSQAQNPNRDVEDGWDARIRLMEDQKALQEEMDSLAQQFASAQQTSLLEQYAFVPAHPKAISYLTANFLHGGWLHLIGNMWFLWLAGAILEDTWGRVIYPIVYLAAGVAAMQFHALLNPGSLTPAIGASGAIAGLMGAFMIRFANTKIEVAVVLGLRSLSNLALGQGYRFKAKAYWLLPLWLLSEVLAGVLFGGSNGVANWAHVGGFIFGALVALGLRYSGLEHKANEAIEAKVTWTADPAIVQGTELMNQGKVDEAIAILKGHVATKPDSVDAYFLLQQLYWRKNDVPTYLEITIKLCQLHLKAQDKDAALQDYQEYMNAGGNRMPAAAWLELCRIFEGQQDYDRAVAEYDHLAQTYPSERQSILALLSAGRLSLKQLHRPSEALRYYKAAKASPVPHLDWESNIQAGIQAAEKAAGVPVGPA